MRKILFSREREGAYDDVSFVNDTLIDITNRSSELEQKQ